MFKIPSFYSNHFPKRIRSPPIKHLITSHHRDQILRLTQINNIVRPSRNHIDRLDLLSAYLKLHHFSGINISFLNQSMSCHNNKKLPFAVVPMLPLGDPRLTDIDRNLSTILCMHKLRKRTAIIHIHFQRICELFFWKICKI